MTIRELARQLRSGTVSSVELVENALRLAQERSDLRAFITITTEQARAEAAQRDRELRAGNDRGPLHGIPIALKDLFYTKDIRTTGASLLFKDFVPNTDADVVTRFRDAGAISIGKTNMHELALGITSLNPHYGHVVNPLDATRIAGGSSGGSAAAIAAGIVPMALGSDTGGSIRIPASYCGIAGFKPTYDIVSRRGVLPLAFSLDHVGPLATSVDDCALTMNVIAGREENYYLPPFKEFDRLRVGLPRNFFFDNIDHSVEKRVKEAVSKMEHGGTKVVDVMVPDIAELNTASHMIIMAEFASLHVNDHDPAQFGTDVWSLLEQGRMVAGHEYLNAQCLRGVFQKKMNELWQTIDILATPTTPITAPRAENPMVKVNGMEEPVRAASTRLVRGLNCLGLPALSIPCGPDAEGLPVSLQLIGPAYSDARVLQVGRALEALLTS